MSSQILPALSNAIFHEGLCRNKASKPQTTVSITADQRYYVEQQQVTLAELEAVLKEKLGSNKDTYISLHADKSVPFESVVQVLNIAQANDYKLIIATTPK